MAVIVWFHNKLAQAFFKMIQKCFTYVNFLLSPSSLIIRQPVCKNQRCSFICWSNIYLLPFTAMLKMSVLTWVCCKLQCNLHNQDNGKMALLKAFCKTKCHNNAPIFHYVNWGPLTIFNVLTQPFSALNQKWKMIDIWQTNPFHVWQIRKLCDLYGMLSLGRHDNTRHSIVMKGLFAAVLLYQELGADCGFLTERLHKGFTQLCRWVSHDDTPTLPVSQPQWYPNSAG